MSCGGSRPWRGRCWTPPEPGAPLEPLPAPPYADFVLPPTSPQLRSPDHRPYFLWWTDCSVAGLHAHLADPDPAVRGYWLGALLREANSRDVWLFTNPDQIRREWRHVLPHLGRARPMWGWLLELDALWPPAEARGAVCPQIAGEAGVFPAPSPTPARPTTRTAGSA